MGRMFPSSAPTPSIHFGLRLDHCRSMRCACYIGRICSNPAFLAVFMLLRAFAKINLGLRILGRRPDGFHEVRTILQTIDWFDEIQIQPSSSFEFSTNQGPNDETNLVVKAVRAFERASGRTASVRINLVKRIPAGAGLGGGSADAAVTFLALSRLYGCNLDNIHLRPLGTDVPFFATGGRALGTGRGDEIQALEDDSDYWLVLVHPD